MAAFSFTVIGVGLLASLRPDGWRLTAWVAGLLPALLGLASVLYPATASSLSLVWSLAAIAWGAMFVAAAEFTKDAASPKLLGLGGVMPKDDTRVTPDREATTSTPSSTPRWVQVFGIIALALVLLSFVVMRAGGGPGGPGGPGNHGPGGQTPPSGVMDHSVQQP